jgi:hypothetical protein
VPTLKKRLARLSKQQRSGRKTSPIPVEKLANAALKRIQTSAKNQSLNSRHKQNSANKKSPRRKLKEKKPALALKTSVLLSLLNKTPAQILKRPR